MQTVTLRDELLARAETVKVLPTLNTIINELFRVMNDINSSFKQLFDVVRYDQAISSKIIGIANSAYYSRGSGIVNLERAMIVIGFEEIKNIIMCLAFLKEILSHWKLSQRDLASLWTHSLTVGYAAKVLSARTMVEEPEKVFTISILHDIGKVLFYVYGDRYRGIEKEARETGRDICVLERETFGIDHQEVGYYISVRWRFPEEFSTVIRKHHGPSEGKSPLLDLVRIADRFVTSPRTDLGPEGMILSREDEWITNETKRISELLGVNDAGK
jgi:putative nucleotidyltransferase with HDIG domain